MGKKRYSCYQRFVISLVMVLLIAPACRFNREQPAVEATSLAHPSDLPEDLAGITILFNKNENNQNFIHVTTLDRLKQKTARLHREANFVTLSPSCRYVAYTSGEEIKQEHRDGIYLHDLQTGEETRVALASDDFFEVSLRTPDFFPEEDRLIFHTTWFETNDYSLVAVDRSGGRQEIIRRDHNLNLGPEISPDGKKIIALCPGWDLDSGKPGFQICIMDSDGTNHKHLTFSGNSHSSFVFTPDSKQVVYTERTTGRLRQIFKKPYYKVYTVNIDGSNRNMLLEFDGAIRTVSPDGQDIVLEGKPAEGYPYSIYLVKLDGGDLRHLSYFDDFVADWYPEEEDDW